MKAFKTSPKTDCVVFLPFNIPTCKAMTSLDESLLHTHQDKRTLEYNLALRARSIFFELKVFKSISIFKSYISTVAITLSALGVGERICIVESLPFLLLHSCYAIIGQQMLLLCPFYLSIKRDQHEYN